MKGEKKTLLYLFLVFTTVLAYIGAQASPGNSSNVINHGDRMNSTSRWTEKNIFVMFILVIILILLVLAYIGAQASPGNSSNVINHGDRMNSTSRWIEKNIFVMFILVIILILLVLLLIRELLKYNSDNEPAGNNVVGGEESVQLIVRSSGPVDVNPEVLRRFPTLQYWEVRNLVKIEEGFLRCEICFEEYQDHSEITIIPNCGHAFHSKCINRVLEEDMRCIFCRVNLSRDGDEYRYNTNSQEDGESLYTLRLPLWVWVNIVKIRERRSKIGLPLRRSRQ
ncbi:hypothetical protein CsatB_008513 [Cannabis sativa]|uniref:RING-type domain-containing protein n=1 Tax=Cannabis sativa TaxID=3483 RepID=A0A7J6FTM7_CANSA|nr:E3 ubiquitin-protein ligase ATL6-like isoform X1 [Cannabis sativa]KAF4373159.1 hypothetical protein F8388_019341 [Cannabis sativa]